MTVPPWSGDSPASAERRRQNALRREQQIRERARESDWVTVAEFCRITSRSRSTVDRWRKKRPAGFPRDFGSTGAPLFKRSEVVAWLESQPLW